MVEHLPERRQAEARQLEERVRVAGGEREGLVDLQGTGVAQDEGGAGVLGDGLLVPGHLAAAAGGRWFDAHGTAPTR